MNLLLSVLLALPLVSWLVAARAQQLQFAPLVGSKPMPNPIDPTPNPAWGAPTRGDVDGDGDVDFVVLRLNASPALLLNDGLGGFTAAAASRMPGAKLRPVACELVDVDADSDLDLVIAQYGQTLLYRNDGLGNFTDVTASNMPSDVDPSGALVAADVDGDGDTDLVIGNVTTCVPCPGRPNRLYLNDGRGSFTDAPGRLPHSGHVTWALAIGDVDGDGDLDLVCGTSRNAWNGQRYTGGQPRLLRNDGSATFTDITASHMPIDDIDTTQAVLGDVDGDGDLDLLLANRLRPSYDAQDRLYLNDGRGVFRDVTAASLPQAQDPTTDAALADVDGDGDLDVLRAVYDFASGGGTRSLWLNDGVGRFKDVTLTALSSGHVNGPIHILTADVDGDGDPDLLSVDGRSLRLAVNTPNGFHDLGRPALPQHASATQTLAVADTNGDGWPDVFCGSAALTGAQDRLYVAQGDGSFRDATSKLPQHLENTASAAFGDVDGDGDMDLVLGNTPIFVFGHPPSYREGQNRLFINDGTGRFVDATPPGWLSQKDWTLAAALADVDGDGDLDLFFANMGTQSRLLLGDGKGAFVDATSSHLPQAVHRTRAAILTDVDRDRDLDLVLANEPEITSSGPRGGQNALWRNDGSGRFSAAPAAFPGDTDTSTSVAAADVDGDGDLDLLFGNEPPTTSHDLWLNDGRGTFQDGSLRLPMHTSGGVNVALADVDLDNDPDIVVGVAGASGQRNGFWRNDGLGFFTDETQTALPDIQKVTNVVLVTDIDLDGDPDVLAGNEGGDVLLFNLHRQLVAHDVARLGRAWPLAFHAMPGYAPNAQWCVPLLALRNLALAVPVPPFGWLGLDPAQLVIGPPVMIPVPGGEAALSYPLPAIPSLRDQRLWIQGLVLHDQAPASWRLTSASGRVMQ